MQKLLLAFRRLNWQLWIVAWVLFTSGAAWADKKESQLQRHNFLADLLVQQPSNSAPVEIVEISDVKVNQTATGIEVTLVTKNANSLQVVNKSDTKSFIAEVPNAQLRLASGNSFRQEKPFAGITEVLITNQNDKSIRITVTGDAGAPKAELFDGEEGLVFEVAPTVTMTQQPQEKPAVPEAPQQP